MSDPLKQIGRLAFRQEGEMWNAYYAMPDSMKDALWIGSIQMAIIVHHSERRRIFMDLMWEAVADIIEEKVGVRPLRSKEQVAPEHEKTRR